MQQQIQLLEQNSQRDKNGEFLSPTIFAQLWAKVEALAGKYSEKSQQVVSEATHKVTIHYLPGVTSAMKVQLNSRVFNVEYVADPDERQVELWLFCYERNDGAQ